MGVNGGGSLCFDSVGSLGIMDGERVLSVFQTACGRVMGGGGLTCLHAMGDRMGVDCNGQWVLHCSGVRQQEGG
jgi:hypothetical protein